PDPGRAAENRVQAVEAERDAAVGRRAVTKRLQEVTEAQSGLLRRNLQHLLETHLLHLGLVNTDRAAAQFDAVHHHVVVLAANFFRIACQQRDVLHHRRGERVMARIPTVLFLVEAQQRKVHHPEKLKAVWINGQLPLSLQNLGAVKPDSAEDLTRDQPLVGGEQNQVALLDRELVLERRFFGVIEERHDRRLPFAVLDLDVGEALRSETLREFGHGLDRAL